MSENADRRIIRIGDFPKGVWKEVPERIYRQLKNAAGWKVWCLESDIKVGSIIKNMEE